MRPEFTDTLAIKQGRHPILEKISAPGSMIPNDIVSAVIALFLGPQVPLCLLRLFARYERGLDRGSKSCKIGEENKSEAPVLLEALLPVA